MKTIRIYTDGGCSGNQDTENTGGWGAVLTFGEHEKTLKGGALNTTNNIMELTAVLEGLKAVNGKHYPIEIYCDSAYVVNCFLEGWYHKWRLNGWKTSTKKPVENLALWQELIALVESFETLRFYKVKGHVPLKEMAHIEKWFNKYRADYPESTTLEDFAKHLTYNHLADQLAGEAIAELKRNL